MSAWDVALQLEAWRQGRAIPRAGRRTTVINDEALLFCPLSMAGWDPSVQAVAIGRRGNRPHVISCADPREWDLHLETFSRLRAVIEPWMEACYADGEGETFPQIVVPSNAAANLLTGLAYRLAWLHVPDQAGRDRKRWTEDARQLGRLLLFFVQQSQIAGQQSVVVTSRLFNDHYAIGQDATDHLGALLAWANPPAGQNTALAALDAAREPLGVRSTPEFDEELAGRIDQFLKVKNGDPSRRSFAQRQIEDLVEEHLLEPVWDAVHDTLDAVDRLGLPPLPALDKLAGRDVRAFHSHMKHLRADGRFAKTDGPRAAVRGLTVMEDAAEQYDKARLWGDPILLAKGRFDGDVLTGTVRVSGPLHLDVLSSQTGLKVRRGDELTLMQDGKTVALVEHIAREDGMTVVRLTCDNAPADGEVTDWAGSPPRWHMLGVGLGKVFRRLASAPSTHRPDDAISGPVVPPMTEDPTLALQVYARD